MLGAASHACLDAGVAVRGETVTPATNRAGTSRLCLLVDDLRAAHASLSAKGVRFHSEPVEIIAGPNVGSLVVYMYDPGA